MNVTIFDILDRLAWLRGAPAVAVVLLAAALAVCAWDLGTPRRTFAPLAFPALLLVHLVGGLLLVDVLDPRLAVVYVFIGLVIAVIVLITGAQVRWGRPPAGLDDADRTRLGLPRARTAGPLVFTDRGLLRLALALLVLAGALWLARTPDTLLAFVPQDKGYLEAAVFGLAGLGLVGLATATEPLSSGLGLLLFLLAFALYYGLVDASITMVVALVALQLVVALVAAYLAQSRHWPADVLD